METFSIYHCNRRNYNVVEKVKPRGIAICRLPIADCRSQRRSYRNVQTMEERDEMRIKNHNE